MKKIWGFLLTGILSISTLPGETEYIIIGGGITGLLEAYYTYAEAREREESVSITVYEKGAGFQTGKNGTLSSNTSCNIVPSLTIDEIIGIIPQGEELLLALSLPFSSKKGIRVDDVPGALDSPSSLRFQKAASLSGGNTDHEDRNQTLLDLGKKSMELWLRLYEEGEPSFQQILQESSFRPCREPKQAERNLHDGYRIDLLYGIPNARKKVEAMQKEYALAGYAYSTSLSPEETMRLDPSLTDFCKQHADFDAHGNGTWHTDAAAIWRPGGCIDTRTFLPKLSAYLQEKLGDRFQFCFNKEVTEVLFDENKTIIGLGFSDETFLSKPKGMNTEYVFCPGEAVGTLENLGFQEPPRAGFAGASLVLCIPVPEETFPPNRSFFHYMEVHKEGIVLAWQARRTEDGLFLGVGGTKALYGDRVPSLQDAFATDRNLLQLNIMNEVLPEAISQALGTDTKGTTLSTSDLQTLEKQNIAKRWVGRRAVAYDGFPTLGSLYRNGEKIKNARCTTHLGSGGVSFGPVAVWVSRNSDPSDHLVQKALRYADSRRPGIFQE